MGYQVWDVLVTSFRKLTYNQQLNQIQSSMLLPPGSLISIFFFFKGGDGLGGGGLAPQEIVNVGLHADSYQHFKTCPPFNVMVNWIAHIQEFHYARLGHLWFTLLRWYYKEKEVRACQSVFFVWQHRMS